MGLSAQEVRPRDGGVLINVENMAAATVHPDVTRTARDDRSLSVARYRRAIHVKAIRLDELGLVGLVAARGDVAVNELLARAGRKLRGGRAGESLNLVDVYSMEGLAMSSQKGVYHAYSR